VGSAFLRYRLVLVDGGYGYTIGGGTFFYLKKGEPFRWQNKKKRALVVVFFKICRRKNERRQEFIFISPRINEYARLIKCEKKKKPHHHFLFLTNFMTKSAKNNLKERILANRGGKKRRKKKKKNTFQSFQICGKSAGRIIASVTAFVDDEAHTALTQAHYN
jgi:hypothetical protein